MIENNNQSSQKNWQQKQNNVEFSQVKRTAKKSNAGLNLLLMFLIAVILVSSGSGFYAWARYISRQEGNANAQVAKWSFKVTNGTQEISDTVNFAITRTDGNSHVEEGKLAPGTNGQIPIVVDTTGTETDLTYDITITINNCPQNMTFTPQTPASTTQTVTGEGTTLSPRVRTIRIQKYIPYSQVGQHNETITWNWPYETTTGNGVSYNDGIDSQDAGKEVTMQIRVVGTEVLAQPVSLATITDKDGTAISNGGTITLKLGDENRQTNKINVTSARAENVTFSSSDTNIATVANDGTVTAVATGNAVITVTGSTSGESVTVNVNVKPRIELQVGDTIRYTPSTVNEYGWNKELATSDQTGTDTLKAGAGQTYNIPEWYVLSVNGDNITMVPKSPSSAVRFQGAQGYNNAVKLLNDACSALYGDSDKGITARSINIEDIENVITTNGDSSKLETAKSSVGYDTQKYEKYTNYKQYPEIYASEHKVEINEQAINSANNEGLGLSQQNSFIERTDANNNVGKITTATSIRPYQTYYYMNNSDFVTALGGTDSIYRKVLLNNSTPSYWVASRCVGLYSGYCGFCVRYVSSGGVSAQRRVRLWR